MATRTETVKKGILSKRERTFLALKGEQVDRVPVSAWGHLIPEEKNVDALATRTLKEFQAFDWDWLKINPRATWFAEGFGNSYDFDDYAGVLPRLVGSALGLSNPDLSRLRPADPRTGVFADHLRLVRVIKERIGDTPFVQTIFSPLSVLGFLLGRAKSHSQLEISQGYNDAVIQAIRTRPAEVHAALEIITASLSELAFATVEQGADGIFFAIVKLAREGQLTVDEYLEFGRPYDLKVVNAARGADFNLLHLCGPRSYFSSVADFPVHAINWASVGQHNPDVAEARRLTKLALIGGVDELGSLQNGSPEDVRNDAHRAIEKAQGSAFLLSPGCGFEPDVPRDNLVSLRASVDQVPA